MPTLRLIGNIKPQTARGQGKDPEPECELTLDRMLQEPRA